MSNTNTDALLAFCSAGLAMATARNVLDAESREDFAQNITDGKLDEAAEWAAMAIYDMNMRCRSFCPADLAALIDLGVTCGRCVTDNRPRT